jgi:hypothetical protein
MKTGLFAALIFFATQAEAWNEDRYHAIRRMIVSYFDNRKDKELGLIANDVKHNEMAEAIARRFESKTDDEVHQLFDRIHILIRWRYMDPKGNFANFFSSDQVDYDIIHFAYLTLMTPGGTRDFERAIVKANTAEVYDQSGINRNDFIALMNRHDVHVKRLAAEKARANNKVAGSN